ncbi:MAG: serine hydrolase [Bacteroidia bacterium]
MKTFIYFILFSCLSIFTFNSCQEDDQLGKADNSPKFNLDLFEQNIIDYINWNNDQPIAWAYTINMDGWLERSDAFGDARQVADGQLDFTLNKEINIASVSKFYTAVAALKLLDANNLTIDSKIAPWLPNDWVQGPGVDELEFKDLLGHRSGLNSINSNFDSTLSYSGLESCISDGVLLITNYRYLNVNFALFRVLIPSLWSAVQGSPQTIDITSSANCQIMFLWYMQQELFSPIGLTYINCSPEDRQEATLYYNVNDNNQTSGTYYTSWSHRSGGGGYFMTTMEMARFNAYYEHTETILSKELRDIMKDNRFGMDRSSNLETHGSYYAKNGSISNSGNGQGVISYIAMFPINGVDIVINMNTQGVTFNDPSANNFIGTAMYRAYNDAWE